MESMDLSYLTCEAALELDNLLLDKSPTLAAVRIMSQAIGGRNGDNGVSQVSRLFDPVSNPVDAVTMSSALAESRIAEPRTRTDLSDATVLVQEKLGKIMDNPERVRLEDPEDVERMRGFFLSLYKNIASQRRPEDEWRSEHPFKKL